MSPGQAWASSSAWSCPTEKRETAKCWKIFKTSWAQCLDLRNIFVAKIWGKVASILKLCDRNGLYVTLVFKGNFRYILTPKVGKKLKYEIISFQRLVWWVFNIEQLSSGFSSPVPTTSIYNATSSPACF
jgi:hypothetical protein